MENVSLQQFLELRQSAQTRMQATEKSSGTNSWQAILEAKRRELGVGNSTTSVTSTPASQRPSNSYASASSTALNGDYRARSEELKAQLLQGAAIRQVGNFLDVRA